MIYYQVNLYLILGLLNTHDAPQTETKKKPNKSAWDEPEDTAPNKITTPSAPKVTTVVMNANKSSSTNVNITEKKNIWDEEDIDF
jgi:hypothetical protein